MKGCYESLPAYDQCCAVGLLCMQPWLLGAFCGALDDTKRSVHHDCITCILVYAPSRFPVVWTPACTWQGGANR